MTDPKPGPMVKVYWGWFGFYGNVRMYCCDNFRDDTTQLRIGPLLIEWTKRTEAQGGGWSGY